MTRQITESAGMVSKEAKDKLKELAYESRMTQRQVLESLILNAQIVQPVRVEVPRE